MTVNDGSGAGPVTVTFATSDTTTALKIDCYQYAVGYCRLDGDSVRHHRLVTFTNTTGNPTTVTATAAIQTDLGLAASTTSTNGVAR